MWLLARWAPLFEFSVPGQSVLAAGLMALGLAIDIVSVLAFLRAKTTVSPLQPDKANTLVVSGLYRISRNPMYLGLALLLTGWAIWLGAAASFLIVAGFVAYITLFQIKPEEAALEETFGDEFTAYCARVRRWI